MKRNWLLIAALVVIVLAVGGYFAYRMMSKPASTTTSSKSTNEPAVNNDVLITKTNSQVGQYLADPNGMALYTYGADTTGVSNCTGSCLANWPAYVNKGSTTGLPTDVGTIKRTDNNQMQYTYKGMPLYYFVSDSSGQVTGDGVAGFHVAKPAASSTTTPSNGSSSSGNPY